MRSSEHTSANTCAHLQTHSRTHAGEGFVVLLDGARFLPASATLTRVTGQVYASDRQPLANFFEVRFWPRAGLELRIESE